jgi:Putative phage metallopeptidase
MPAPTFDLSARLDALCRDLCATLPQLAHIDPDRLLFTLVRSRAEGLHGTYARIVPLRFAGGASEWTRRRGRMQETFRMPTLVHGGRDIYYVISLLIPRFLRLSLEQKLTTVVHELYHISPACDGDIRRFAGRNYAHGRSRAAYNRTIAELLGLYRRSTCRPDLMTAIDLTEEPWLGGDIHLTGLALPLPRPRLTARRPL